jgi:hypothetical protein
VDRSLWIDDTIHEFTRNLTKAFREGVAAGHPCCSMLKYCFGFLGEIIMCRNIKTLFNFEPPATDEEIQASSLQFVRKLSGFTKPSKANEPAFEKAVAEVTEAARTLLASLVTNSEPRDREIEAARARARTVARFG